MRPFNQREGGLPPSSVRAGGLEPPRAFAQRDLNPPRLPVPPRPRCQGTIGAPARLRSGYEFHRRRDRRLGRVEAGAPLGAQRGAPARGEAARRPHLDVPVHGRPGLPARRRPRGSGLDPEGGRAGDRRRAGRGRHGRRRGRDQGPGGVAGRDARRGGGGRRSPRGRLARPGRLLGAAARLGEPAVRTPRAVPGRDRPTGSGSSPHRPPEPAPMCAAAARATIRGAYEKEVDSCLRRR